MKRLLRSAVGKLGHELCIALSAVLLGGCGESHAKPEPAPGEEPAAQVADARDAGERQRVAALAIHWPTEPSFAAPFDALDPGASPVVGAKRQRFDPVDQFWGLPRSEGYLLVAGYCGYCHSLRLVMQQQASAARWDELLDWMIAKQGMPALAPADRAVVRDYLARHFGPTPAPE